MAAGKREMIPAKDTTVVHDAGQLAGWWIEELLLTSRHFTGLVCPLCWRIAAATCAICGAYLCPDHDVACHVAGETICDTCWRKHN
jgi:hypothetical protein